MNKIDLIHSLAKPVQEKIGKKGYGHFRKSLLVNISEIALYSVIAEHCEANDIAINAMVDDVVKLIKEASANPFYIKTSDDWGFLASRWEDLSINNNPPEKTKFICNTCFYPMPNSKRSSKPNYKNCCADCYKKMSNESSKRYQERKKAEIKELEMNGSQEEIIELGQEIVPEPVLKQEVIENIDPYISLKSVMADANQATVELTCLPQDLLKVLSLVDSLLVRDSALKECAKNH